jgi:phosphonate transport system substrate-binding protein
LACGRKLTFGLGDAKSTSGTLAPLAYLFTPRGIDPGTCFKQVRSASHQANLLSVANGVLEVATNNTVGLLFARRENPDVADKIETIWTSPDLPEAAIVVHPSDLDPATVTKIADFFAGYGKTPGPDQARQQHILQQLTYVGFSKADNGYLLPVRQMEASNDLAEAKRGGDPGKIKEAQARYDALTGPNPPPIAPVPGA